jgi:hypothetical protein
LRNQTQDQHADERRGEKADGDPAAAHDARTKLAEPEDGVVDRRHDVTLSLCEALVHVDTDRRASHDDVCPEQREKNDQSDRKHESLLSPDSGYL